MTINDVLNEGSDLLLEAGLNYHGDKSKVTSIKILHHDDMDGVFSAIAIGAQATKEFPNVRIETWPVKDGDDFGENDKKLEKRKGQLLFVVDFNRFKDKLKANDIDIHTDHHGLNDDDDVKAKGKSLKPGFRSDFQHITSEKARNLVNSSDLSGVNAVDSADFGDNLFTNNKLQLELSKKDGVKNYKVRLAIITSTLLGQLVRTKKSKNVGAVQAIIKSCIKSPTIIKLYNEVISKSKLQREQIEILKKFKTNKKMSKEEIQEVLQYNQKSPREMNIGIQKDKKGKAFGVKKHESRGQGTQDDGSHSQGQGPASSLEQIKQMSAKQIEKEFNFDTKTGKYSLKNQEINLGLKPREDDPNDMPKMDKKKTSELWAQARKVIGVSYNEMMKDKEAKAKVGVIYKELEKDFMSKKRSGDKIYPKQNKETGYAILGKAKEKAGLSKFKKMADLSPEEKKEVDKFKKELTDEHRKNNKSSDDYEIEDGDFKGVPKSQLEAWETESRKKIGFKGVGSIAHRNTIKERKDWVRKQAERFLKSEKKRKDEYKNPMIKRASKNIAAQTEAKGGRYNPFIDDDIKSSFRDFRKFWQMSLNPKYDDRIKALAKKHGNEKFEKADIDLIKIGQESQKRICDKMITLPALKKAGVKNPEDILALIKDSIKEDIAKSGGHKSITNMGFSITYQKTVDKWFAGIKKAKAIKKKAENPERKKRAESIVKNLTATKNKLDYFMTNVKNAIFKDMTATVQKLLDADVKNATKRADESFVNNIRHNAGLNG